MKHVILTQAQRELFYKRQRLQQQFQDLRRSRGVGPDAFIYYDAEIDKCIKKLESTPSIVACIEVTARGPDGYIDHIYTQRWQSSAIDPIADVAARFAIAHPRTIELGYQLETRVVEIYESRNDR